MRKVKVIDQNTVVYPYSFNQMKKDHPNISFPNEPERQYPKFGVLNVIPADAPTYFREIEKLNDTVQNISGSWTQVWTSSSIDYDETEVRANIIANVKAEANSRIVARVPEWKQRNYLAYSLEMTRKEAAGTTLTAQESATMTFIEGEWAYAISVRAASDTIEGLLAVMTVREALSVDIANHPEWPV